MSREIKRVPMTFDWPLYERWEGFLMPERLNGTQCPLCEGSGDSARAQYLQDLWYGNRPFSPYNTGSTPWTADTPAIRRRAEWAIERSPDFYGTGEFAIDREAARLADLFNRSWNHHLAQEDVDALVDGNRLHDFTHTRVDGQGWVRIEPTPVITAAQVNEWSLSGMSHDAINAMVVIQARCEREGVPDVCQLCDGHGYLEDYPGQRADAEAWEPTEPPTGEGWQMWETVSEGSPISPVMGSAEELATWISQPNRTDRWAKDWMPYPAALKFVLAGWAPTAVLVGGEIIPGAEYVGMREDGE